MNESKVVIETSEGQITLTRNIISGVCSIQSELQRYDTDGDNDVYGYNGALDGIEALVLAQYAAGVDVSTKAYSEALENALEAVYNNLS